MYFHYFVIISHWKRWDPSFEQTLIPFTQRCIVALVEIGHVALEKKMKMWKFYDVNENDNNNDGQWTKFDQKSSLRLMWAKTVYNNDDGQQTDFHQ